MKLEHTLITIVTGMMTLSMTPATHAAITISGSVGNPTTVSWDEDIEFTITKNHKILGMLLIDLVAADDTDATTNTGSGNITYKLNGGADQTTAYSEFRDDGIDVGDIDPTDSMVRFELLGISAQTIGTTFTLPAQTLNAFTALATTNPDIYGTFTGSVVLISADDQTIMSNTVVVPEPYEYALLGGVGLLGFGLYRKKHLLSAG